MFKLPNFPPDGLLGLAFQAISVYNAPPFFQTLVAQGSLPTNSFGFFLAKEGPELFLGGTNDKLHNGDFTYVPLTNEVRLWRVVHRFDVNNHTLQAQGYWQTNIDALNVNGQRIASLTDSIIDAGTTLILGDNKTVQAIYDQIPGSAHIGSGFYSSTYIRQLSLGHRVQLTRFSPVPCLSSTIISVQIGGADFAIDYSTFNLGAVSKGSTDCHGGIAASDGIREHLYFISLLCLISISLLGSRRCVPTKRIHGVRRRQ